MKLQVIGRNVEVTTFQRELVERRLNFAPGRFGDRVHDVSVTFCDVNGPRGGVDTACRIVAAVVPRGTVRVEVTDVGVEAAVTRAAERLARRVNTELERRRAARGGTGSVLYPDGNVKA